MDLTDKEKERYAENRNRRHFSSRAKRVIWKNRSRHTV